MKVALLTNFIPPYRKSLLEELSNNVDHLKVFVSTEMEKNRDWQKDHGALNVEVQKTWSYSKNWTNEHGYSEKSTVHLPRNTFRVLRKMKPDAVISGELGFRSIMASVYCKWYKKPLILWLTLSERTESNKKGVRKYIRKYLLKSAATVLGNGRSCDRYIRSLNYTGSFFFVPYTTDFTQDKKVPQNNTGIRTVLSVGQLIERKGISEMVNALCRWSDEHPSQKIQLVIAGDGPERSKLDRFQKCQNVQFDYHGTVDYSALPSLYENADLFLFPTLGDEWGVVVNEALSYNVPVIGSVHSQAVEELIEDGVNGWCFYSDKSEDFDQVLKTALAIPSEKLMEMKKSCPEALKKVTVEAAVENIIEAIKSVC